MASGSDPRYTGTTRAGWGQESFIHPTVEVPPSNYDSITNQGGPEPSQVVAGNDNISVGIDVGVVGSLRDDPNSIAEFPMEVKVVDVTAQSYGRPGLRRTVSPTPIGKGPLPTLGKGSSRGIDRFHDHSVPRISVRYATDSATEVRLVRTKYDRFPTSDMLIPMPNSYAGLTGITNMRHYRDSVPCLFYDKLEEKLIVFNLYNCDASYTTSGQRVRLGALEYKQGVNYDTGSATDFWTIGGVSGELWNLEGALFTEYNVVIRNDLTPDASYQPPMVSAVQFQGSTYVIVSDVEDYDGASSIGCGGFYVLIYSPRTGSLTDAFRPIVGPIKPSSAFATRIAGLSAACLRNSAVVLLDALVDGSGNGSSFKRQVQYSRSTDMRNWGGEVAGKSQPYTIGAMNAVARENTWKPIDVAIDPNPADETATEGWAVTADHEILYTKDGGQSWELEAEFDDRIDFYSVCVTRTDLITPALNPPTYRAFAFTKDGIVLRRTTRDDDPTWEICSAANPSGLVGLDQYFMQDSDGDPVNFRKLRLNGPAVAYRGVAVQDNQTTKVWIVGSSAAMRYNGNGGTGGNSAWKKPENFPLLPNSDIRAIEFIAKVSANGGKYRLAIAGDLRRLNGTRGQFMIVSHSTGDNAANGIYSSGAATYVDGNDVSLVDTRPINGLYYKAADHLLYFCGDSGALGEIETDGFDGDADVDSSSWLSGSQVHLILSDTTTKLTSVYEYTGSIGEILLVSDVSGALWRATPYHNYDSSTTGLSWVRYLIDGTRINRLIPTDEENVLMVTTSAGLYRGDVLVAERQYPTVVALEDFGHYLMACVNITDDINVVEVWKSTDDGLTFQLIEEQPINAKFKATTGIVGRPTLTVLDDGSVMLTLDDETDNYKQKIFWSFDGGDTWALNTDPAVPMPLASSSIDNGNSNDTSQSFILTGDASNQKSSRRRKTRSAIAYGGGPVYTAWQNSATPQRQAMYRTYAWTVQSQSVIGSVSALDGLVAPAIAAGRPRWIGLDDIRVVFSGLPAIQDLWEIELRYRYDVRNVNIESPSIYYESSDNSTVRMEWDRTNTDVMDAIGDGNRWQVDAFAIFGTNFPRCTLRVAEPTYSLSTFPTIAPYSTEYVEFPLNSIIEYGEVSNLTYGSVLIDNSKNWIPHQWRPAHRTYYIATYDQADPGVTLQAVKILDNTENSLILETILVVPTFAYMIYGDRFYCDGTGGTLGDGAQNVTLPSIRGSIYQYPKIIQLEIPSQATPDNLFRMGSFVFGKKTPLRINRAGDNARRRFNRGFGWTGEASIREDQGLSGVTTYEQFGRIRQTWSLRYEFIQWWDRDHTFNALLDKPKRAFVIQFDDTVPQSVELVRLANPPRYENVSGDYYDFDLALNEVI